MQHLPHPLITGIRASTQMNDQLTFAGRRRAESSLSLFTRTLQDHCTKLQQLILIIAIPVSDHPEFIFASSFVFLPGGGCLARPGNAATTFYDNTLRPRFHLPPPQQPPPPFRVVSKNSVTCCWSIHQNESPIYRVTVSTSWLPRDFQPSFGFGSILIPTLVNCLALLPTEAQYHTPHPCSTWIVLPHSTNSMLVYFL